MDTFVLLGSSFYFMNPTFNCRGEPDVVDERIACPKLEECTVGITSFNLANNFTITAYLGLYCDREGERDAIQSLLSLGSLLGLVLMNYLADLKGRKTALMLDLVIGIMGIACKTLLMKLL